MPELVTEYVSEHYEYIPEFYITFFEVCERLTDEDGRIGMLTPRSFMFKRRFSEFREDFIGEKGSFDFLAEYGLGILDNATVRTVGTVVRNRADDTDEGAFIRLYDLPASEKEGAFLNTFCSSYNENNIKRLFTVSQAEFEKIPGMPICYSTPADIRQLHSTELKFDADAARVEGKSLGTAANGMNTGDNSRFV
jgi:hypothetical protein